MHKSSPHSRRHFLGLAGTSALAGGGAAVTASRLARGDQQQQTVSATASANNGFPALTESERLKRLAPVKGKVRMVLDTDAYNEVDDQFAIAYSLLSPERLDVEAIYAAPFLNRQSTGPGDGMEKSYHEILRVLDRMGGAADRVADRDFVFRGSKTFLSSNRTPVDSPAARDLVERAMSSRDLLYVVAIGAPTNVASAILLNPMAAGCLVIPIQKLSPRSPTRLSPATERPKPSAVMPITSPAISKIIPAATFLVRAAALFCRQRACYCSTSTTTIRTSKISPSSADRRKRICRTRRASSSMLVIRVLT